VRRAAPLAVALLIAGWALTLWVAPWSDERVSDLFVYRTFADPVLNGSLPYRDVAFEYPPLAWPVIATGGVAGTGIDTYRAGLGLVMFAFALAVVLLCGRLAQASGGDPLRAMLAAALLPLLLGAVGRSHFDPAAVALLLGALLAVLHRRSVLGGALLGAAVMTKGFPLAAAPAMLAWVWARGGWDELWRSSAAIVATAGVIALGALALSPGGAYDALQYQLDRPAQVESSQALVLRALGGDRISSHGGEAIEHDDAGAVSALFVGALCAAVSMFAFAAAGEPRGDPRRLLIPALASVTAFAVLGEVLSPQFLTWVVPLGALAAGWAAWPLACTVALATLLTLVEFPALYVELVRGEAGALAVLAVRDLALIAVIALAALELSRPATAAARSRWPGPRRQPRSAPR
jgi:uncharacterized membrane protein